jgi:transcriptional regulator of heat shock response
VLVAEDGQVENRVVGVPVGLPTSALTEASNFLNAHIRGRTLDEARSEMQRTLEARQAEIDELTQKIVAAGMASWSGGDSEERKLIVRGQAHLLEDVNALADLERVRLLFDVRFVDRRRSLSRRLRPHRRRARRHRPDAAQLCPRDPHGRLHRQSGQQAAWGLIYKACAALARAARFTRSALNA